MKFSRIFSKLPSYLESHAEDAIKPLKADEHFNDYYKPKFEYIKDLISYLGHKIQDWISNVKSLADKPEFNWLELGFIFDDPKQLVTYVPRCKNFERY